MKVKFLTLLIIGLAQFLPFQAQSPEKVGLLLNGTVVSATGRDFGDHMEWSYTIFMVLRNDGNRPIILYKDCFAGQNNVSCETKIDFLYQSDRSDTRPLEEAERPVFSKTYPASLIAQFWPRLVNELNAPQPPTLKVSTIDPGRTYEFDQTFVVKQKFWRKDKGKQDATIWESLSGKDDDSKVPGVPLSDASALRITYRFSPMVPDTNADSYYNPGRSLPVLLPYKDPDFLKNLSKRWRESGIFPVDSSGSFSIKSERIVNGLYQNLK